MCEKDSAHSITPSKSRAVRSCARIRRPRQTESARQYEKDTHSVIINIPQSRPLFQELVCDKQKLIKKRACKQVIRKPSEYSLRKYTLSGNKPLQTHPSQKDKLLLSYKLYAKKQDIIKRKQHLGIKLHEQYKIKSTDLRKRLHIEHPPDGVQAVTDIDDGYFRYLSGYSSTQYIPLFKSLKFLFHNRLRIKQEIGYRRDCILNVEVKHRREQNVYDRSVQRYVEQVKQFDEFISVDYQKSMVCLKNWEAVIVKVNAKASEKQILANSQFIIQCRLIGLNYMYFLQQKYGRFLYYLSPPSWRSKHRRFARSVEIEAKGFDLGTSSEEDAFNVIFEKMQNECYSGLVEPVIYYTHPEDLITMFESIEKQQLHNYIRMTQLAAHSKKLQNMINKFSDYIVQDSGLIAQIIEYYEKLVDFCEERETQLQAKFMKILNGIFYDTVAAIDVLKLQMDLEFCYETLFAEKSSDTSILLAAKAIEEKYLYYSFKLDGITNENIKLAVKQCIAGEKNKLKRAHVAARELCLFARLEHTLMRAHEKTNSYVVHPSSPVKRSSVRKTKPRSSPKSIVRASSQRELTEAEYEYLSLFTNWTENENPANYLQSLNF